MRTQFVPVIKLIRTNFILNQNQLPAPEDNETTTIDELFDSITTAGGFTYYSQNRSVEIVINDCRFINNSANVNDASSSRPVLLKPNGHGGAVLIRLAQVTGAKIHITNSFFEGNRAEVDGGAIYFSLSENFAANSIFISNSSFLRNRVFESAGGAISWNTFSFSFNNSLILEDCKFIENIGSIGGAVGISLYDTSINNFLLPDNIEFIRCMFHGNMARNEGTAVGLYSLVHVDESGFPVDFINWYVNFKVTSGFYQGIYFWEKLNWML